MSPRHLAAQYLRRQPPPEKCDPNAWAKPPKPPRVTWPLPVSDDVSDDEWLEVESPLKKLLRDDDPPCPPLPEDELRGWHSALPCGAAIPGGFGAQCSLGISA